MSANDEMSLYLQSLLDHQADCHDERCPSCLALKQVLESVRFRIFSGPIFPDIRISKAPADKPKKRTAPAGRN